MNHPRQYLWLIFWGLVLVHRAFALQWILPDDGDVYNEKNLDGLIELSDADTSHYLLILDHKQISTSMTRGDGFLKFELGQLTEGAHQLSVKSIDNKDSALVMFYVTDHKNKKTQNVSSEQPDRESNPSDQFEQYGRFSIDADYLGGRSQDFVSARQSASVDTLAKDSLNPNGLWKYGKVEDVWSRNLDGNTELVYGFQKGNWDFKGRSMLSSQENDYHQSENRYSGKLSYRDVLTLSGGDVYPRYQTLLMGGSRLRGSELQLRGISDGKQKASLQLAYGQLQRAVSVHRQIYYSAYQTNGFDTSLYAGDFSRSALMGRIGFGRRENHSFGISFIKAKDDVSSLDSIAQDKAGGENPADNLGLGLDWDLSLFDGSWKLFAEAAVTMYSKNIYIDPLSGDSTGSIKFDASSFEPMININESTRGIERFTGGNAPGFSDIMFFLDDIAAYRVGTQWDLNRPTFRAETILRWIHQGNAYYSMANPFLMSLARTGFELEEVLRFYNGKVVLLGQVGQYIQDQGESRQKQLEMRSNLLFAPGSKLPRAWVGGGYTSSNPDENFADDSSYTTTSHTIQMRGGASHYLSLGADKLHGSVQILRSAQGYDTTNYTSNSFSSQFRYEIPNTTWEPSLTYGFWTNQSDDPAHQLGLGWRQKTWHERLQIQFDVNARQYPTATYINNVVGQKMQWTVGDQIVGTLKISSNQQLRLTHYWTRLTGEDSYRAGLGYEVLF